MRYWLLRQHCVNIKLALVCIMINDRDHTDHRSQTNPHTCTSHYEDIPTSRCDRLSLLLLSHTAAPLTPPPLPHPLYSHEQAAVEQTNKQSLCDLHSRC